jgi:hypothetical protein
MRSKLLQTNSLFRLSRTLLQPDSYPFSQIPTDRDDGPCDLFRLTDRDALDGSKMQALSTSLYPRMHLYTGVFCRRFSKISFLRRARACRRTKSWAYLDSFP